MRALLVDDEELARNRLKRLLQKAPEVAIVGEACDGPDAMEAISRLEPDLVFLDVEMPGCSGLEVVRSLPRPRPRIVFCTGYDQYAVDAFEVNAVDYLLKPVSHARLDACLARLREAPVGTWDPAMERVAQSAPAVVRRFLVRVGGIYRVIASDEVDYISSDDGMTALHTAHGRFWMEPSLNALEQSLHPAEFCRISRGAIVRLDAIREIATLVGGHAEARLRGGAALRVSRRRFQDLLRRVAGGGMAPRDE